jgi:hypothetical protein
MNSQRQENFLGQSRVVLGESRGEVVKRLKVVLGGRFLPGAGTEPEQE